MMDVFRYVKPRSDLPPGSRTCRVAGRGKPRLAGP